MSTRFEIIKNGERVCIAGINGDGSLNVTINYLKHPGQVLKHELIIGGLGKYNDSKERNRFADWLSPQITTGDEITIRILPAGKYDEPYGMKKPSQTVIDDPDFGQLKHRIDSWDGNITFDSAPIKTAHIHVRADESGPSIKQKSLINELRIRHIQLWPEICSSLVKCHPDIKTIEELSARVLPHVGINIYDESDRIELTYSVAGDPELRGYFIILRDWSIAEVFMAE